MLIGKISLRNAKIIEYYRFDIRIAEATQNVAFLVNFEDVLGFFEGKIFATELSFVKHTHHTAIIKKQQG